MQIKYVNMTCMNIHIGSNLAALGAKFGCQPLPAVAGKEAGVYAYLCILDVHFEMRRRQGWYVCVYTKTYMRIYVYVYVCHAFSLTCLDMTYICIYLKCAGVEVGTCTYIQTCIFECLTRMYIIHLDMTYIRMYV